MPDETLPDPTALKISPKRDTYLWVGLLCTYLLLFGITSYISFFQEPYNPGSNPSAKQIAALADQQMREHVLLSLREESEAFKRRKELAGQSFNVVLGALLGFLSATATGAVLRQRET